MMKECEQSKDQSVYDHGLSVWDKLLDLVDYLKRGTPLLGWRIPEWLQKYRYQILENLLDLETLQTYAIFHDVGKPFCKTIDENGRSHFPNHAQVSHDKWLEYGGTPQEAKLMKFDMLIHTIKDIDIDSFIAHPEAISLLLTGLAEIHANADMFGGICSDGFKIKWKQIDRRGNKICQKLFR